MKYSYLTKRTASHTLIFGNPGTGKSTLIADLAKAGFKLWWFSIDNGHTVIEKLPEEARNSIEIFVLPNTPDFPVGCSTILKASTGAAINICDAHGQVECPGCKMKHDSFSRFCGNELGPKDIQVIDPLTKVAQAALAIIAEKKGHKPGDDELNIYKMTEPDWGTHWGIMDKILTNIEQCNWNVCATAHVLEGIGEDNQKSMVPMVGTRNFSVKCPGYFDNSIYASTSNKEHKFGSSTVYMMNVLTKSRKDVSIENLTAPSLVPFFDGTIGPPPELKLAGTAAASKTLAGGNDIADLLKKFAK